MTNSRVIILFVFGFCAGIFGFEKWVGGEWLVVGICCVGGVVFLWRSGLMRFFGVVVVGFVLGMFRLMVAMDEVVLLEGNTEIEGCVVAEVDVRVDKVKYVVEVEGVMESGASVEGKVLVNAARYPVYEYGDCLRVGGFLKVPDGAEGGEDFDYRAYLMRYGVRYVMYADWMEKVGEEATGFHDAIFWIKGKFEGRLEEVFAEPVGSFMAGLLLGTRRGIPEHLMEGFNLTGLTHIIAISGYNITLVICVVSGLVGFLGRRWKVILSLFFIFCFCVLVGASSAVVRAGIMGSISLMALWFGRTYFVEVALVMSAFLMNLWNPFILIYDVGFQLSFLATTGLIFVSPRIEKYFEWLPSGIAIRESVLMTLSAQIMALPVIIYTFGRLSLISPIANLIVLPMIPISMLFGFFAVVGSFLWSELGLLFGFFGDVVLEFIIWIVNLFAKIKFASLNIEWASWWMIGGYYYWLIRKLMI